MNIIDQLKETQSKYEHILKDIDKTKTSKILKYFAEEIKKMEEAKTFQRTEQISILSKTLNIEIKYQTYNSFVKRNIEPLIDKKDK